MPLAARITIIATLALICAGAAYLMLARGPTLLIDLSAAASRCCVFKNSLNASQGQVA